jgi:hypothetical protein
MIPEIIDIAQRAWLLEGVYENAVLSAVNGHSVRISMMPSTLTIDLEDQRIELAPGQMCTIPQGVAYCTQPQSRE